MKLAQTAPIPKTKASEVLEDLTNKCLEQRFLTPF